jgi:hypothetical protein
MVRTGTDEMGVLSVGCNTTTDRSPGALYETSYQVAQTWAGLLITNPKCIEGVSNAQRAISRNVYRDCRP